MYKKSVLQKLHALVELKAGNPICISLDNGEYILISSSEHTSNSTIKFMKDISGSEPSIIVNKERMLFLGQNILNDDIYSISFHLGLNRELCHEIAFSGSPEHFNKESFQILRQHDKIVFSKLLTFFKKNKIIPSFLYCVFSKNEKINSFGIYLLDEVNLDDRNNNEFYLEQLTRAHVPIIKCKDTEIVGYRTNDGSEDIFAIILKGADKQPEPIVRIHSQCITGDLLNSLKCDCGSQLNRSIDIMSKKGGILLYMPQEGRDIGFLNKLRSYEIQANGSDTIDANHALGFDADQRNFYFAAEIIKSFKISSVRLITNNPEKNIQLEKEGVRVLETFPLIVPVSSEAENYIHTKKTRSGHKL